MSSVDMERLTRKRQDCDSCHQSFSDRQFRSIMKGIPVIVFLLALTLGTRSWELSEKQVLVQVYYESLCPYSISWIVRQLSRTYKKLGPEWMAVELVPFGKAKTFPTEDSYAFRCEHGSAECVGNKLQACALARLSNDNQKQVNFVVCVMGQPDPSNPSDDCAKKAGLDAEDLRTCADGEEGVMLEAALDPITPKAAMYAVEYLPLPLILFNKESRTESDISEIRNDFLDAVCDKIYEMTGTLPDACVE